MTTQFRKGKQINPSLKILTAKLEPSYDALFVKIIRKLDFQGLVELSVCLIFLYNESVPLYTEGKKLNVHIKKKIAFHLLPAFVEFQ